MDHTGCSQTRTPSGLALGRLGTRRALASGESATACGGAGRGPWPTVTASSRRTTARCSSTRSAPTASSTSCCAPMPVRGGPISRRYADDIAEVSLAAAPFVASFVRRTVAEVRPANVLDIGCGTGVYTKVVARGGRARPSRRHRSGRGGHRRLPGGSWSAPATDRGSRLHVGDARSWSASRRARFDLVMLLNNIYYFERQSRAALYREIG